MIALRCLGCILLVLAFVLAACESGTRPGARIDPLDGTSWRLDALEGRRVPGGLTITLAFSAGEVSGAGPCTRYRADYQLERSRLSAGALEVDSGVCEAAELEQAFIRLFQSLITEGQAGLRVAPDRLEIGDSLGTPVLLFSRLEPGP